MRSASFTADAHAPARARRFVAATVRGTASRQRSADLAVIVSELVTNAVRAGTSTVEVGVRLEPAGTVRVEVGDSAPGWPGVREVDEQATGGRGLQIVLALADTWGVERKPPGKLVWAELPAE